MIDLKKIGADAKEASRVLANAETSRKNLALGLLAEAIEKEGNGVLQANLQDIEAGKKAGLNAAMLDRLSLQGGRLQGIAKDIRHIVELPDPIGEEIESCVLPNGLKVSRRRTPIGVAGVIYESRPNVTIDAAALTLKTGNGAILRGGSETLSTNRALVKLVHKALQGAGLPVNAIQLIESPDRSLVKELLRLHEYVDIIIPRGGEGLHRFCRENSTIPVITGGIGVCHLFVDDSANVEGSLNVIHNAKTQRPTVCNALDTILVHEKIASGFIPKAIEKLGKSGVAFRLDPLAWKIYRAAKVDVDADAVREACPSDWDTEWMSLVLGIRVVSGIEEAIAHIRRHSTGHSDGILTDSGSRAAKFLNEVDSAAVYHNASTRFTDGGQLGLGAEVAISTQKLHARGPMGLKELTSYKWVVQGDYHIRT